MERPGRAWQVIGVLVTRRVTPAACVRKCPTVFFMIDTLRRCIEDLEG